ncbi:UNVERIFIED_CONTAM: hypothetical protein FKN15_027012 [Acipenser sinensis]
MAGTRSSAGLYQKRLAFVQSLFVVFLMGVCTAFHVVMGDLSVQLLQGFNGEEVGSCGYMCFMDAVKGNILSNLPSSATMDGVHVVLLASVVMSIPSIIQPCRQAIGALLFKQQLSSGQEVQVRFWSDCSSSR